MTFRISLVYNYGCEERNPNQTSHHGPNFRSGNSEILDLNRSSLCQASPLILNSSIYRASVET